MKTAMEKLWDYIDANYHEEGFNLYNAKEISLKEEKEQSIIDYSNGFLNGLGYKREDKNIMYGVIMQSKAEGDIYYNETYNENK
jgi:hypothetical protein